MRNHISNMHESSLVSVFYLVQIVCFVHLRPSGLYLNMFLFKCSKYSSSYAVVTALFHVTDRSNTFCEASA